MTPTRLQLVVLTLLGAAYVVHAASYGDWLVDDAGITFAYARNFADGRGMAINAGEAPVEGYSNPAWTFLCALLYALGLFTIPATPKLVAGACVLLTMVVAWQGSRRASGDPDGPQHLLAPAVMAGVATFVQYTMSGLENAFYVLCIVSAWAIHVRERRAGRGWLGGLLAFLVTIGRPEGIAYAFVLGVDRLVAGVARRDPRLLLSWLAGFGIPLALYAAWHASVFEDPLPNTYYAKIAVDRGLSVIFDTRDGGNRYLRTAIAEYGLYWMVACAPLALAAPRRWLDGGGLALAGFVGVAASFGLYAGGDWMPGHRLLSPIYPLLALAAAAGLSSPRLASLPAVVRRGAPILGFVVSAISFPVAWEAARSGLGMRLAVQMNTLSVYARWGDQLGLERIVIGLADVGGPSLTTTERFTLVDLFGLTDRRIAHQLHRLGEDGREPFYTYVFHEKRVDFLQFPEAIWRRWELGASPDFTDGYWAITTLDTTETARFGSFVRRDLVEGALPEGVPVVSLAAGLRLAARLEDGGLTLWWDVAEKPTAMPLASVRWRDAAGAALRTDDIRPFGGVLGFGLFEPGRVLRERWRGAPPSGAAAVEVVAGAPRSTASSSAPATPATPAAAIPAAAGQVPNGDFEAPAGAYWTSVPGRAPGWTVEDGALRVDLGAEGLLVCSGWTPLPPRLTVAGRVRAADVENGDKPWKSAAVTLRVRHGDGTQAFPNLVNWKGSFDWQPFEARYTAGPNDVDYRLCFGSTGALSGTLWVDDLSVGSP